MATCPSCGTENPEGHKFCSECGTKLEVAPVREERKVVTVLFCDLVGFTARSDRADPEDVRAIVRPFHELLRTQTERFGGTLARIVGDAGMVVFGYPTAHEDDPERAVRAGFSIVEGLERTNAERPGLDLHARVGINTCEAVVTYGSTLEDADDLMGDGVNLAARLQSLAPPDGIVVGEATYTATSHLFAYEALEPTEVKGKAEPVTIYRPTRSSGRVGRAMQESTPFVGREPELEALINLFERSRTTPATSFVTVVAEPGIGKSRLVRELARHVEVLPELITWRVGHCLPYGDGISFWALGEIIKAHAGIFDTDDQATLASKLDRVLAEPDESLRAWMRSRIAPLVGLDTTAQPPQQEEAFTAWRRFLEQIATERPLVLVIEDLHWADDALVAFLQHLAERTSDLPLLVVATARPEVTERHPGWSGDPGRSELTLAPLGDADITTLVGSVLEGASPELVATVLERAGGSPLYAEQLAAMLAERAMPIAGGSLDEGAIPSSVQALLAARIDALTPELKATVLDASVVGKSFWSGALAALGDHPGLEGSLDELARRGLIRPSVASAMEGEAEFSFVHALVRDVAYAELTRAARMTKHRATAAWITERAGGSLGEDAEIVVAHLDRALELAEALGARTQCEEIEPLLLEGLLVAADFATRTEVPIAIARLDRARRLLPVGDRRVAEIQANLGHIHYFAEQYWPARDAFLEARAQYLASGREVEAALLCDPLRVVLFHLGDEDRTGYDVDVDEADRILRRNGGPGLVDHLASAAGEAFSAGSTDRAKRHVDEALSLAGTLGVPVPYRALVVRGRIRLTDGDRDGEEDLRKAFTLADAAGDLRSADKALDALANDIYDFSIPLALAVAQERVGFMRSHGFELYQSPATIMTLSALGRWDEALAEAPAVEAYSIERGDAWAAFLVKGDRMAIALDRGDLSGDPVALAVEARTYGLNGQMNVFPIAARLALAQGQPGLGVELLEEMASRTATNNLQVVADLVRAASELQRADLARSFLDRGTPGSRWNGLSDGLVTEIEGDTTGSRAWFATAAARLLEVGNVPSEALALTGLGRCLLRLGETDEGVARLQEARELWVGMKAAPRVAEIDELLATVG